MCSYAVLKLGLQSWETPGVEKAIVVDHWPEEKRMGDWRVKGSLGCWLNILISFFGGFMKEEDVVGLKAHDSEFFTICSIVHLRIY